ncbi:MAG: asparagine synthase B [Deltaproteobacteria bacterium]|nr:asparagine synthase B [Deltaproteobacteria bacterium]MBU50491.1 asparagine synthase B [Deltaproteobacteria bacterium]|tara:strand:+ start:5025 stop:6695 length:1671 start_codon:yes stop_codon:yes gene_type:complete
MCGIVSIFRIKGEHESLRKQALELSRKIRHRGPDWSGIYADESAILAHERLAIVGIEHGAQPLFDEKKELVLAVNGEIYNHQELKAEYTPDDVYLTASDCEVIIPLYRRYGRDFLNWMNGIFAFTLYDKVNNTFMIARDPIGVIPLYWGWDEEEQLYVSSEMKALVGVCQKIEEFPPGHVYCSEDDSMTKYYEPVWAKEGVYPSESYSPEVLREALIEAVRRQLMCDVPYGVLLSGGLDSSIISAIAAQFAKSRVESQGKSPAWWPQIHSFSIGLEGSPDLEAAQKVAEHIGTIHHNFHFTLQEGLDALRDVIYHIETYDVTTIRASTPMYLISRKIKAMGIKMLLSGEGADEIFGGYLYFHKAPDREAFHDETVRKLDALHMYDCLRANKSTAAWGIEARVPFLDVAFLDVAMKLDAAEKMTGPERMEKYVLRKAFEDMLPHEIVWRQKEQFSDGVGYGWIDALRDHADAEITDEMLTNAAERFPVHPPQTKEAYFYRSIFEEHFPGDTCASCIPDGPSIACSTPAAIAWDASFANQADPSGRAVLGVHQQAKDI